MFAEMISSGSAELIFGAGDCTRGILPKGSGICGHGFIPYSGICGIGYF